MPGRRSLGMQLPVIENAQHLCPPGLEACYTSDLSMKFGRPVGWECVDTSSDIESCGGCEWPVAGQIQGQDCSELAGVSKVTVSRMTRLSRSMLTPFAVQPRNMPGRDLYARLRTKRNGMRRVVKENVLAIHVGGYGGGRPFWPYRLDGQ